MQGLGREAVGLEPVQVESLFGSGLVPLASAKVLPGGAAAAVVGAGRMADAYRSLCHTALGMLMPERSDGNMQGTAGIGL